MEIGNSIGFNSSEWEKIRRTIEEIKSSEEKLYKETDKGETIIYELGHDGEGDTLTEAILHFDGWMHTRIYHPSDYLIEEIYRREARIKEYTAKKEETIVEAVLYNSAGRELARKCVQEPDISKSLSLILMKDWYLKDGDYIRIESRTIKY